MLTHNDTPIAPSEGVGRARGGCSRAAILALALGASAAAAAETARPPEYWTAIPAHDYAVPEGAKPFDLLLEMNELLGSPDPVLRDDVAYGVVPRWVYRQRLLTADEQRRLVGMWSANLRVGLGERLAQVVRSIARRPDLDGAGFEAWLRPFPDQNKKLWAAGPAIDVESYITVENAKGMLRAAHAALAMDGELSPGAASARDQLLATLAAMR
jgi:hypothetical protein